VPPVHRARACTSPRRGTRHIARIPDRGELRGARLVWLCHRSITDESRCASRIDRDRGGMGNMALGPSSPGASPTHVDRLVVVRHCRTAGTHRLAVQSSSQRRTGGRTLSRDDELHAGGTAPELRARRLPARSDTREQSGHRCRGGAGELRTRQAGPGSPSFFRLGQHYCWETGVWCFAAVGGMFSPDAGATATTSKLPGVSTVIKVSWEDHGRLRTR
jgi:hypothetical protein